MGADSSPKRPGTLGDASLGPTHGWPWGLQLQPREGSIAPQITQDHPKAPRWGNPAMHPHLQGPQVRPFLVLRAQQPLRAHPGAWGSLSCEENPAVPAGKTSLKAPLGSPVPIARLGTEKSFVLDSMSVTQTSWNSPACRVCAQPQPAHASVSPAVKQQGGSAGRFRHCSDVGNTQITPQAL